MPKALQDKILDLSEAKKTVVGWRNAGLKSVFTNGVFDIVHRGHIDYLYKAASKGDRLIIGLNSDSSVKRLGKGDDRPINAEAERAFLLAAFSFVDLVVVFSEDTPIELIRALEPDVLTKGGDYDPDVPEGSPSYIVGSKETKARGGEVLTIPFIEGFSSTKIIEKIRSANGEA